MLRKAREEQGDKPFQKNPEVAAKIERDANPEPDQHNGGQPLRQQLNSRGDQQSKLVTGCSIQHRESLQCIEQNYENKAVCQPFFDAYKQCRHDEHKRRLEENERLSREGNADTATCIIS